MLNVDKSFLQSKGLKEKPQNSQQECSQRSERTGVGVVLHHNNAGSKQHDIVSQETPFFDTRLSSDSVSSRNLLQRPYKTFNSSTGPPACTLTERKDGVLTLAQPTKRERPLLTFSSETAKLDPEGKEELSHLLKKARTDGNAAADLHSGLANLASACVRVEAVDMLANLLRLGNVAGHQAAHPKLQNQLKSPESRSERRSRQRTTALLRLSGVVKKRREEGL